ncbi:MAG: hypothetical protein ACQKBY_01040 [Verrucomicrobiales bacterium]
MSPHPRATVILLALASWLGLASLEAADTLVVSSLKELNTASARSDQRIKLQAGSYALESLPPKKRALVFSGSRNHIDLRGVILKATVGSTDASYLVLSGNGNTILGGEFEDLYANGMKEVTDFGAYNRDRQKLARGLRGDPVMSITGDGNTVTGSKLTVRGSFPYGYGSIYGIGGPNTFGLNKRCGILSKGVDKTLDGVEI